MHGSSSKFSMNKNFQQANFTSTSSISSASKSQIISNESLCSEQSLLTYLTKSEQFDGISSARSIELTAGNMISQDCSTVSLRDGSSMTIDECVPPIPVKTRNRNIRRERHVSQYDNIDEHDCASR